MKRIVFVLLLLLAGCEGETIKACAYACMEGKDGRHMLRWSVQEGCICEGGEKIELSK